MANVIYVMNITTLMTFVSMLIFNYSNKEIGIKTIIPFNYYLLYILINNNSINISIRFKEFLGYKQINLIKTLKITKKLEQG